MAISVAVGDDLCFTGPGLRAALRLQRGRHVQARAAIRLYVKGSSTLPAWQHTGGSSNMTRSGKHCGRQPFPLLSSPPPAPRVLKRRTLTAAMLPLNPTRVSKKISATDFSFRLLPDPQNASQKRANPARTMHSGSGWSSFMAQKYLGCMLLQVQKQDLERRICARSLEGTSHSVSSFDRE